MSDSDLPPLRMAPSETPQELARRQEEEKRANANANANAEAHQTSAPGVLGPYRVGSVPYLNAVPLTRGLETEIRFLTPARLAELLQRDELDAALVSVTEVLFNDRYDVVDGIAVASLGEVRSVYLAHRGPLKAVREVYCDPASLTSVHLLRVLLAERGLHPELKVLAGYDWSSLPDYALLIGDPALDYLRGPHDHSIWDLGAAWYEQFQLPFVYAVWAVRRGIDHPPLCQRLREAKDFGMETLDSIIAQREEYDLDFRKDYLGWHIHYHLGSDERRALNRFIELLRKHGSQPVYPVRFV